MNVNYIIVRLCDNDFGQDLEKALTIVFEKHGTDLHESIFRRCMVELVSALNDVRSAAWIDNFQERHTHLYESISVEYSSTPPTEDHDGGSVAVDVNTGYIWRF